jgi:hypothetical protein
VTRDVGQLSPREIEAALEAGAACARDVLAEGLIEAAALRLQGKTIIVSAKAIGKPRPARPFQANAVEEPAHA